MKSTKTCNINILLLSFIKIMHATVETSQCYNGECGQNSLNQGQINHIDWIYSACIGGMLSITRFTWSPNPSSTIAGTCTNVATDCPAFTLTSGEYINAYRIFYNPGINRIYFRTNLNNEAGCGAAKNGISYTDSGWITYANKYLSGFNWNAGWILDGIQFQFTSFPTSSPTLAPTPKPTPKPTAVPTHTPTKIPTSLPTIIPTYIPTVNPTLIPTSTPTYEPTYEPTFIPSHMPTQTPSMLPTIPPTRVPTKEPVAELENAVDEISSTQLTDEDNITFTNTKRNNDTIFILIIVGVSVLVLAFIILLVFLWKRKLKSTQTNSEIDGNIKEIETNTDTKFTKVVSAMKIGSVSPMTSDIDDNMMTNGSFFTNSVTPLSVQMTLQTDGQSVPPRIVPAVIGNYGNINTEGADKIMMNNSYNGEESEENNQDIIDYVNNENNTVTAGGNMDPNVETKRDDQDIVNVINNDTNNMITENQMIQKHDYDIVNAINKTHGANVKGYDNEFEVMDDNIVTIGG
eukprot:463726_1